MYTSKYHIVLLLLVLGLQSIHADAQKIDSGDRKPQLWLTDPDHGVLFSLQNQSFTQNTLKSIPEITVDKSKTYQQMDGFGFALTGGSAMLINNMSVIKQADLLKELFGTNQNSIGVSYLRVSLGASDLDDHVFSYDDLRTGEKDPDLKKFSVANDKNALIPVLKKILAINPHIKILAS